MIGKRLRDLFRANLNALLERMRERDAEAPLADEPPQHPPGWRREIAQHYANLELAYGSDFVAVKKQYRKLMSRYHPDRHGSDPEKAEVANRLAAELTRSYEALAEHLRAE